MMSFIGTSSEPHPPIDIPYMLLLSVMAKDHIFKANRDTVKTIDAQAIKDEYNMLLERFPDQIKSYLREIETRRSVLK